MDMEFQELPFGVKLTGLPEEIRMTYPCSSQVAMTFKAFIDSEDNQLRPPAGYKVCTALGLVDKMKIIDIASPINDKTTSVTPIWRRHFYLFNPQTERQGTMTTPREARNKVDDILSWFPPYSK
jgi:hypothetical protein